MATVQAVTFAIALLGAVLGVINTWKALDRDRVKLRVVPKVATVAVPGHDPTPRLCIEVVNLSTFPVTVHDVGLKVRGSTGRIAVISPILFDGKPWPRRLEARESVTVYMSPEVMHDRTLLAASSAYARTECGVEKRGTSPALTSYVGELIKLHAGTTT